jgi:hypothetical protein
MKLTSRILRSLLKVMFHRFLQHGHSEPENLLNQPVEYRGPLPWTQAVEVIPDFHLMAIFKNPEDQGSHANDHSSVADTSNEAYSSPIRVLNWPFSVAGGCTRTERDTLKSYTSVGV